MARPVWTGVLTFGLVTVPVAPYTATQAHDVRFHQLQRGTPDRVRSKRVNERTGTQVDFGEIVTWLRSRVPAADAHQFRQHPTSGRCSTVPLEVLASSRSERSL
ncbi:Ku protein [Kitasatospora sp. NBC_01246]|uniref:Ku protein n=1 Tax=Kitasatospora sp. NBC_01246 TaxID=2903570 RepID=UPI003FA574E0